MPKLMQEMQATIKQGLFRKVIKDLTEQPLRLLHLKRLPATLNVTVNLIEIPTVKISAVLIHCIGYIPHVQASDQ
jgi:hypothetical protein